MQVYDDKLIQELNLYKIYGTMSTWNKGSEKAAMKASFHLEAGKVEDWYVDGEYVDTRLYAIFKPEWDAM